MDKFRMRKEAITNFAKSWAGDRGKMEGDMTFELMAGFAIEYASQVPDDALNTAVDQSRVIEVMTERIERLRAIMGKVMKRSEEMYTVLKLGDALRDDTNALAEAQRILEGE